MGFTGAAPRGKDGQEFGALGGSGDAVVNVTGESYYPGGAANVARNLREFTSHTSLMGLAGAAIVTYILLDA